MIKKTILLLLFVLPIILHANPIEKIEIHYININIETPFSITCPIFESSFEGSYHTIQVVDNKMLDGFSKLLGKFKKTAYSKKAIDVRAKAYIYYTNGEISILCLDRFAQAFVNGKYMGINKGVFKFISKYCKDFK